MGLLQDSGEKHPCSRRANLTAPSSPITIMETSLLTQSEHGGWRYAVEGVGNIPAHAERTVLYSFPSPCSRKHPCSRRANPCSQNPFALLQETSLLTQSELQFHNFRISVDRNIPAHAERTRFLYILCINIQKHPCSRRANTTERPGAMRDTETSLLTQSELGPPLSPPHPHRNIPAHAERTHG